MADLLNMGHINALPQPFIAHFCGGDEWPVWDIDVETGLMRIDVCGKLDIKHVADVITFTDANGASHDSDSFYSDYLPAAVVQPQHPSHDGQAQSASPNGDDARKSQQSKER